MANRDLNFNRTVTDVTVDKSDDPLLAPAEIGAKIADMSAQSKLLAQTAAAQVAFKKLDAGFRTEYAGDPTNEVGLQKLAEDRQSLVEGLGEQVPLFYRRQFTEKTTSLAAQSDATNELWTVHQNSQNTVNNVNGSIKTYLGVANSDGQAFGASDSTDFSNLLNYAEAKNQLEEFGGKNLGAPKTGELLKTFEPDYVKSFIAGVAETSPAKASQLISNPDIAAHFTTEERGDMIAVIDKVKKQKELQSSLTVTSNNGTLIDLVNDNNTSYFEKRAEIDRKELSGEITPSAASKARRVIKSSADIDTQTSTPVMSDIIKKVYDLNANSDTNSTEYLRGVRNLQEEILDKQATGELQAKDASALTRQVNNLTAQKISSATQQVGVEFYDANKKFDILPPEYRGDATRKLFYATDGKNLTKPQQAAEATKIIDDINTGRRSKALGNIDKISGSDPQFLKSIGYTAQDVSETAAKYHISESEVMARLRAKRSPARQPITKIGTDAPTLAPAPAKPTASVENSFDITEPDADEDDTSIDSGASE